MPARFLVRHLFPITGRGIYVSGDLLSGPVSAGMQSESMPTNGAPVRLIIESVEFADFRSEGRAEIALRFHGLSDAAVRGAVSPGTVLEFSDG